MHPWVLLPRPQGDPAGCASGWCLSYVLSPHHRSRRPLLSPTAFIGRHMHTQTHTQNDRTHSSSDETCMCLIFPLLLIHKSLKSFPLCHFWQVLTIPLKGCHSSSNNLCEKRVSVLSSFPFFLLLLPSFSPLYLTVMGTCFYLSVLFACIFF